MTSIISSKDLIFLQKGESGGKIRDYLIIGEYITELRLTLSNIGYMIYFLLSFIYPVKS